jgi:hypothetical protein
MDDSPTTECRTDGETENRVEVYPMDETPSDVDDDEQTVKTIAPDNQQTITMSVTVPVGDMSGRDRQVLAALAEMYERNFETVVAKNRDYSWSFLRTGSKLAATDGTPFDSHARAQAFGLLTRIGDKHERLIENVYGDGDATVSDSPATTAREAASYYFFLALVLDNPELAGAFLDS